MSSKPNDEGVDPERAVDPDHTADTVRQGAAAADRTLPTRSSAVAPPNRSRAEGDLTGRTLAGKYRVLRLLGQGGFGAVYEALDELLEVKVAIKVLTGAAAAQDDALVQFREEAKRLTTLDHPNVVRWISFDRMPDGTNYFVMELLDGEELSDILEREGKLSPQRVMHILLQTLSALKVAHELPGGGSLLHLDLKPRNVFVVRGEAEQIKVIDFGISQHVGAVARRASGAHLVSPERGLDRVDVEATIATVATPVPAHRTVAAGAHQVQRARGGTLMYASPEHCQHLIGDEDIVELDGRSDIYSLGIMAFQMLAGRLPWQSRKPMEVIKAQMEQAPPKLASLGVKAPRGLIAFVDRCLQKDRDDRYADVKEAHAALELVAKPPSPWPKIAAAAAAVAVFVVWLLWPDPPVDVFDVKATDNALFLGPAETSREVALANLLPALAGAPVRLVADTQSADDLLPEWRKALVAGASGTVVRIEAPAGDVPPMDREVYVRVGDSSPVQFSQPLRLVYLNGRAWTVDEVGVPGAGDRAIDPRGALLEVALGVPERGFLAAVQASFQGRTLNLVADANRTAGTKVYYTLALNKLGKFDDATELTDELVIEVSDLAGNRKTQRTELRLDARPLTLDAVLRGCASDRPGSFVVYPQSQPVLVTTLHRAAAITCTAADQNRQPIVLEQSAHADGIALRFPPSEQTYVGELTVTADDDASVYHAEASRGRGVATRKLQFVYQPKALQLIVRAETADHFALPTTAPAPDASDAAEGTVYFCRHPELSVSVSSVDVQALVDMECRDRAGAVQTQQVRLLQQRDGRVAFPLASDGRYQVTVRGYRYGGAGSERAEEPEYRDSFVVVRDTQPPTVQVAAAADAVFRKPAATEPLFELQLRDDVADGSGPAQVAMRWQLQGPGGRQSGQLSSMAGARSIDWQQLGLDPAQLIDGRYVLTIDAVDGAGNTAMVPATYAFEFANAGPDLQLRSPRAASWTALEGNRFRVAVRATDANGVVDVTCTLREIGGSRQLTVPLRADGTDTTAAEWSGEIALPKLWSDGRQITLACAAHDRHGNATELEPRTVRLEVFEVPLPSRLTPGLADSAAELAPMRLVRGAPSYTFGGRAEPDEQATLRQHGLQFDVPSDRISSKVDDFYLDETEVTVAQYLAFVRADDGYQNRRNWSRGSPVESRRAALQQQLGAVGNGRLPVTGVDWNEADAYARWAGKELPTMLQWEYAVRGGFAYRPFSCAGAGHEPARFNVANGAAGQPRPWPVDQGSDVTPGDVGAGIRNLCSNVSEWTASPMPDSELRFAAGASYRDTAYLFSKLVPYPPDTREPYLGFRCAWSAAAYDAALEGNGRLRIQDNPR